MWFRARVYAQAFTLLCLCVGSVYWKEDRERRGYYRGLLEEKRQKERRDRWIRELEVRDEEERGAREERGRRREKRQMQKGEGEGTGTGEEAHCAMDGRGWGVGWGWEDIGAGGFVVDGAEVGCGVERSLGCTTVENDGKKKGLNTNH